MSESQMSDSRFSKSFFTMIALLILLTLVLVVLANLNSAEVMNKLAAEQRESKNEEVSPRVAPVGTLSVGEVPQSVAAAGGAAEGAAPGTETAVLSGEEVYQQACAACHGAGVAGAPKLGDAAAWADRIAQGADTLHDHAIHGFQGSAGVMPAKGGNPSIPDDSIRAAVDYMIGQSQ